MPRALPRLTVHVFGDGERVPLLHGSDGLPLFYPTLFATSQLRNAGVAVNTVRNKLADIAVLLRWEEQQNRDLISEFQRGRLLSLADVASLRDYAKLDMRYQGYGTNRPRPPKAESRASLELKVGSRLPMPAIGTQQHYNRLSTMADYLEFVARVTTTHLESASHAQEISRMASTIRKHRPRNRASRPVNAGDPVAPSPDLIARFMAVSAEASPENPFRDPGVRLRNAIVFGLLRFTGMRRGELLSLRLDQIEMGDQPRVWIRRNHDDALDSRRYQPVAKTKERLLPIPNALVDQIYRYIMNVRVRIAPARKHPYLLVSHRRDDSWGAPLSAASINSRIFHQMALVDPEFKKVSPHAFRRFFNYELSLSIDRRNAKAMGHPGDHTVPPISEARESDVRAYLMGHRSRESGAVYNRRHIQETSDRAVLELQAALNSMTKTEGQGD